MNNEFSYENYCSILFDNRDLEQMMNDVVKILNDHGSLDEWLRNLETETLLIKCNNYRSQALRDLIKTLAAAMLKSKLNPLDLTTKKE